MPKILAIDDKQDNLTAVSALLKILIPDCEVITALSGPEGLEKAKNHGPDTILLDIKMPGMDGYEVCNRLKADEATRRIPVIMLTAVKTDSDSRIKGLETGADAFLAKPIDEYVLAAQVKTALRVKKAEDDLRREKEALEKTVRERTQKLVETEERYKTLFNNAADAIFIRDPAGRFLEVNDEACKRLQYTRKELLHISPGDIDTPEYAAQVTKRTEKIIKLGEYTFESRHRTKDGTEIPVEINSRLIDFNNQKAVLSIARDISQRKRMEEEREFLQSQLQQANKMEAIGTLAGGIAHDFNNILFPIIGYTELLIEDLPQAGRQLENAREILQSAERAADLVKQILTFSRKDESKTKPMLVQTILKEALKLVRASLPATIEIRQNIDPDCRPIMGDPVKVHQIIMNLCTNAFHAMHADGGILSVELRETVIQEEDFLTFNPSGACLQLTVGDTGSGIPPEIAPRIFDPFFTTKPAGQGTGMGLSTVYGIVMSYGGNVRFNSTLDQGTAFEVFIPVIDSPVEEEKNEDTALPRGNEHILLVDDEDRIVAMIQKAMESLGYKVTACGDGLTALNLFCEAPHVFNLLLSDVTMPKMTGNELARKVLQRRPELPVILMTGHSDHVDEKKAEDMGVRALIMKPVRKSRIAKIVREALDRK